MKFIHKNGAQVWRSGKGIVKLSHKSLAREEYSDDIIEYYRETSKTSPLFWKGTDLEIVTALVDFVELEEKSKFTQENPFKAMSVDSSGKTSYFLWQEGEDYYVNPSCEDRLFSIIRDGAKKAQQEKFQQLVEEYHQGTEKEFKFTELHPFIRVFRDPKIGSVTHRAWFLSKLSITVKADGDTQGLSFPIDRLDVMSIEPWKEHVITAKEMLRKNSQKKEQSISYTKENPFEYKGMKFWKSLKQVNCFNYMYPKSSRIRHRHKNDFLSEDLSWVAYQHKNIVKEAIKVFFEAIGEPLENEPAVQKKEEPQKELKNPNICKYHDKVIDFKLDKLIEGVNVPKCEMQGATTNMCREAVQIAAERQKIKYNRLDQVRAYVSRNYSEWPMCKNQDHRLEVKEVEETGVFKFYCKHCDLPF